MTDQVSQVPIVLPSDPTLAMHAATKHYVDTRLASNVTIGGNLTLSGDLLPDGDNTRSLGSPDLMWKDIYIGPGSLYLNGQKILQDDLSGTIVMSADTGQNISIQTLGTGDIELAPQGSGLIQLKGTVLFQAGSLLRSTDGSALTFDDAIQLTSGTVLNLAASIVGEASLNMPHGVAPTTLSNGDMWTTTAGLFTRINGATRTMAHTTTWTTPTVAEAQAGTATTARLWTAQLVADAIVALGVSNTLLGAVNGVATLGADGKLTAAQMPAVGTTDASTLNGQPGSYYNTWGNLTGLPTTLSGFGITDAVSIDRLGALTTSGVKDWNDISNARPGTGVSLLRAVDSANAPPANNTATYFHSWSLEYGTAHDGTGQITQFALPYANTSGTNELFVRGRYSGTWGPWVEIWTSYSDGAGSGMDADLLDGQEGTYYLAAANLTGTLAAARSWALTGDVTSAAGSAATTIANGVVTNVKLANSTITVGTTSIALGASSASLAGLTSVAATTFTGNLVGNASTATKLTPAVTIGLSGVTGTATSFDGGSNITIPVTAVPATLLTGAISAARSWALTGDVTSAAGSAATTLVASSVLAKLLTVDGTGSGLDADTVDGKHAASFAAASDVNLYVGTYSVNTATPAKLAKSTGTTPLSLNSPSGSVVDVEATVTGTGTATSAVAQFISDGTAWTLIKLFENSTASNNPEFFIDTDGDPAIRLYNHPSLYTVVIQFQVHQTRQTATTVLTTQVAHKVQCTTSETPPATPNENDEWIKGSTGRKYTWFNDGDSTQWVEFESADLEVDDTGNVDGGGAFSVYGGLDPIDCGGA